ncbi:hypothetical protein A3J17_00010 [Candidatus Curtissbacteria bacterium RIFCSPLOWO2_02_FULL_40_11]|nr:MAG: hypothetical protein A3J17_00010 [Candidatus Curtissbacteria bacterium RIFCSPLOWO2_02_FULL_40_11]
MPEIYFVSVKSFPFHKIIVSDKLLQLKSWSFVLSLHELCWRSVYSLAFIFDVNVEVFSRVNIKILVEPQFNFQFIIYNFQ